MIAVDDLPMSEVNEPVYRIILSRYPQVDLFERVSNSEDWDVLYTVESLTNPRLRDEVGDIRLVPPEDRVYGDGASWIMAAFTHPPVDGRGGRFNRDFGIYYCAADESVAIAESSFHRARFLRESRIEQTTQDMRVLRAQLTTSLHDVRQLTGQRIYHPDDYGEAQQLGYALRDAKSHGVHYQHSPHLLRPPDEHATRPPRTSLARCRRRENRRYCAIPASAINRTCPGIQKRRCPPQHLDRWTCHRPRHTAPIEDRLLPEPYRVPLCARHRLYALDDKHCRMDRALPHRRTRPRDQLVQERDHRAPWLRVRPCDHRSRRTSAARHTQRRPHHSTHPSRPIPDRGKRLVHTAVEAPVRARGDDQKWPPVQLLIRPRHRPRHYSPVTQRHRHLAQG